MIRFIRGEGTYAGGWAVNGTTNVFLPYCVRVFAPKSSKWKQTEALFSPKQRLDRTLLLNFLLFFHAGNFVHIISDLRLIFITNKIACYIRRNLEPCVNQWMDGWMDDAIVARSNRSDIIPSVYESSSPSRSSFSARQPCPTSSIFRLKERKKEERRKNSTGSRASNPARARARLLLVRSHK